MMKVRNFLKLLFNFVCSCFLNRKVQEEDLEADWNGVELKERNGVPIFVLTVGDVIRDKERWETHRMWRGHATPDIDSIRRDLFVKAMNAFAAANRERPKEKEVAAASAPVSLVQIMDISNKDEAYRCIELAEQYILAGKTDRAEKFLIKSEKLYPTKTAKDLLESLRHFNKHTTTSTPKPESTSQPHSNMRQRVTKEVDYTPEQIEAVKRIKKCKDYYEILGVTKEATDSEIKKAYKKMALHLHPDKNHAPGAAEAFKAIGNAVAILTDVEKRKQYDMFGSEDERIRQNHTHSESYTRGFESDVSPEEFFNMFFGGSFPGSANVYVRRGNQWRKSDTHTQQTHRETTNYSVLMQMLPVLILIALSMMSSLLVSDPVYSLTQTSKFPIVRQTMKMKIPYYVKENFHSTYQGTIGKLEMTVEEEYVANLKNSCYREKTYRESMMWRARNFGDSGLYQKAQGIKTPSCDNLQDLTSRRTG